MLELGAIRSLLCNMAKPLDFTNHGTIDIIVSIIIIIIYHHLHVLKFVECTSRTLFVERYIREGKKVTF